MLYSRSYADDDVGQSPKAIIINLPFSLAYHYYIYTSGCTRESRTPLQQHHALGRLVVGHRTPSTSIIINCNNGLRRRLVYTMMIYRVQTAINRRLPAPVLTPSRAIINNSRVLTLDLSHPQTTKQKTTHLLGWKKCIFKFLFSRFRSYYGFDLSETSSNSL